MTRAGFDVDVPRVDYITLTSFSETWRKLMYRVLNETVYIYGEPMRTSRIENYKGMLWESGAFVGSGEQGGRVHNLARVSGDTADRHLYMESGVVRSGRDMLHVARCTRIDLQVTMPIVDSWDARQVSGIWQQNGLNARLLEGGNGMDTIYIGSRQSAYFWRVYVKEDVTKNRYLRWELQINKADGHSISAWEALQFDGVAIPAIMSAYAPDRDKLETGDDEWDKMVRRFVRHLEGEYMKPKRVRSGKFYTWLVRQVAPGILARVNDHDVGQDIKNWLERMVEAVGGRVVWDD